MGKLPICRICLCAKVKMSDIINHELQELYQELTCVVFETEDQRPNIVCNYCVALLKKSLALKLDCQAAEYVFSKFLDNNTKRTRNLALPIKTKARFSLTAVEQISIESRCCETIGNVTESDDEIKHETNVEKDPLSNCDINSDVKVDKNPDRTTFFYDESDSLSNDITYEPPCYESSTESDHKLLQYKTPLSPTVATKKDNVLLKENEENFQKHEKEHAMETQNDEPCENTTASNLKGKRIRQRDYCYYCKKMVLNFSRHMARSHTAEQEVKTALSFPKNSLQRKQSLMALRKKGNYVTFKPVKSSSSGKTDYIPCPNCLGFYSKKGLWLHVKKCSKTISTRNIQIQAQNFLLRDSKIDNNLVRTVFPHMKPDNLSLVAKKDKLICKLGALYLTIHPKKHFYVSSKMRDLGKLLLEVMKMKPNIESLDQILKPEYYEILVHATKIVARYDNESRQFHAPSYAINIATSIKRCCDIVLTEHSKMEASAQTAAIQTEIKALCKLMKDNWKFDINDQATDNINVRKWNKLTIEPLARDVKTLNDYLHHLSQQSSDKLTEMNEDMNIKAFDNLVESTYCRVLLLNRLRPAELLQLKLSDYKDYENNRNVCKEFDKVLSSTERMLVFALKIFVIRGKNKRGVPVLFSNEVEEDIKKILSVRHMYVEDDNNWLFVKAGGTPICHKVFGNYAVASGAKDYRTLRSARPKTILATMTQLFHMNESELERLATLMSHKLTVDNDNGLSREAYHTANICKLLLLIEDGKEGNRGKDFDDMDVCLEYEEVIENNMEKQIEENPSRNRKPSAKKKKVPWTDEQKTVVTTYFKEHIECKKVPKRAECDELKNIYPILFHNKDWLKIKVYIQNIYTKRLK